jgi:hypothetical protein
MLQLEVYLDDDGAPRAEAAEPHELLGRFLQFDLRRDAELCSTLLAVADELLTGARERFDAVCGNCALALDGDRVRLTDARLDPPSVCELSIMSFRFAVEEWLRLIGSASD